MTLLTLRCGKCGEPMAVPADAGGKVAVCPSCGTRSLVPKRAAITTAAPSAVGIAYMPDFSHLRKHSEDSAESILSQDVFDDECAMNSVGSLPVPTKVMRGSLSATTPDGPSPLPPLIIAAPNVSPNIDPFAELAAGSTVADSPSPRQRRWQTPTLVALGAYAAVATALAVWGWCRTPANSPHSPDPIPQHHKT